MTQLIGRRSSVLRWMAREVERQSTGEQGESEMVELLRLAADELDRDPAASTAGRVFDLASSIGGEELQTAILGGLVEQKAEAAA